MKFLSEGEEIHPLCGKGTQLEADLGWVLYFSVNNELKTEDE